MNVKNTDLPLPIAVTNPEATQPLQHPCQSSLYMPQSNSFLSCGTTPPKHLPELPPGQSPLA